MNNYTSISSDGRYIAFCSRAGKVVDGRLSYLVRVLVRNAISGKSMKAGGRLDGFVGWPAISADGRFVAFQVDPREGASSMFLYDLKTGKQTRISKTD